MKYTIGCAYNFNANRGNTIQANPIAEFVAIFVRKGHTTCLGEFHIMHFIHRPCRNVCTNASASFNVVYRG